MATFRCKLLLLLCAAVASASAPNPVHWRRVNAETLRHFTALLRIDTLTVVKEKSPASFEVEQNLQTMNGARTITFDSQTNHILTMSQERGPAPPPPPGSSP